jgi:hypothetical protein
MIQPGVSTLERAKAIAPRAFRRAEKRRAVRGVLRRPFRQVTLHRLPSSSIRSAAQRQAAQAFGQKHLGAVRQIATVHSGQPITQRPAFGNSLQPPHGTYYTHYRLAASIRPNPQWLSKAPAAFPGILLCVCSNDLTRAASSKGLS